MSCGVFASDPPAQRPLPTRQDVEALRIHLVKHPIGVPSPAQVRDLCDALLAAWDQLDAVDRFAEEGDERSVAAGWGYGDGHAEGKNALRRELRALRGIEA